jgi:hypothetical protein
MNFMGAYIITTLNRNKFQATLAGDINHICSTKYVEICKIKDFNTIESML